MQTPFFPFDSLHHGSLTGKGTEEQSLAKCHHGGENFTGEEFAGGFGSAGAFELGGDPALALISRWDGLIPLSGEDPSTGCMEGFRAAALTSFQIYGKSLPCR